MAASSSSSGPIRPGSYPAAAIASASVTPAASASARARPGSMAPVISRLPRQATPNRPPSSSLNAATPSGRAGTRPRSRSRSTAANADTTPSGPSKAPPSGTESRWLPVTTASPPAGGPAPPGAPGGSHHAQRLPLLSVSTRSPRSAAAWVNHARHAASSGVQEKRRYPPEAPSRPTGSSESHRPEKLTAASCPRGGGLAHRHPHPPFGRHLGRLLVAGVHVPDHAHARVVGEDPLQLLRGQGRAVGDAHLPGVDRAPDAHPAAVVDAHPRRAGGGVDQRVEDRPVGDRVRAVGHRLGLPVGRGDRPAVEVITADDDRRRDVPAGHELVEAHAGLVPLAVSEPADPGRQPLEMHLLPGQPDPPGQRLVAGEEVGDGAVGDGDV